MSDIQRARDVLTKWRSGSTPGPWAKRGIGYIFSDHEDKTTQENGYTGTPIVDTFMWPEGGESNLALIVGTAGNPDLLDAIDFSLAYVQQELDLYEGRELKHVRTEDNGVVETALRFAAAIIAADERMSA